MKAIALALFLAGCNGCQPNLGPPVPPVTPPAGADAGTCVAECIAAVRDCRSPVITEAECESRCAEGLRFTKNSARCIARTSVCNAKDSCP
jgi:hypothetical protein